MMTNSRNGIPLKFSEWRPIGVCDQGRSNQRTAKMFSKTDFERVCSTGVNRMNWKNRPEIMKIVERYAKDISKRSSLTKEMKRPRIAKIHLVGAVLGHDQTPELNLQSKDGRVQLFQVEFEETAKEDAGKKPYRIHYALLALFCFATLLGLWNWLESEAFRGRRSGGGGLRPLCNQRSQAVSHTSQMKELRRELIRELKGLPDWSRLQAIQLLCSKPAGSLEDQEILFLRCLISTRQKTQKLGRRTVTQLGSMESCAVSLCREGLAHLKIYCRQL